MSYFKINIGLIRYDKHSKYKVISINSIMNRVPINNRLIRYIQIQYIQSGGTMNHVIINNGLIRCILDSINSITRFHELCDYKY